MISQFQIEGRQERRRSVTFSLTVSLLYCRADGVDTRHPQNSESGALRLSNSFVQGHHSAVEGCWAGQQITGFYGSRWCIAHSVSCFGAFLSPSSRSHLLASSGLTLRRLGLAAAPPPSSSPSAVNAFTATFMRAVRNWHGLSQCMTDKLISTRP